MVLKCRVPQWIWPLRLRVGEEEDEEDLEVQNEGAV